MFYKVKRFIMAIKKFVFSSNCSYSMYSMLTSVKLNKEGNHIKMRDEPILSIIRPEKKAKLKSDVL